MADVVMAAVFWFGFGAVVGGLAVFEWCLRRLLPALAPASPEVTVEPQITVQVNGQTIGRVTGTAANVTVHPMIDVSVCATAAEAAGYDLVRRPLN